MSNRDSLGFGDLLPQDVIDIFAQEKHSKRGRKKRTRSFSRAFGLFKRKKKKNLGSNGESHGLGLGPALDLALDEHRAAHHGGQKGGQKPGRQGLQQGNSHAVPKRNVDKTPAPPLFQENVFIEGSRSKYVEDLHSEAQEGLKMLQQEESSNGMEFRDNESTVSTATVQTDGEGTGFVTDSTIPDTSSVVSVQSSLSVRSSRSGLTRQGSTFRPLNSGKKSEKSKMRRKQRKTVAGIPRHVQKELGLDRVGCTMTLNEEQIYNGETDLSPTTDGSQHEAESPQEPSPSLQASNIIHPLSKDRVKQLNAAHGSHRDDLALLHRLSPLLAEEQRPRSLAVPWMTAASGVQQQPPSPVMTMSPQAAYMSKIIPNAVLPPSIDVVEISRSRSRSSVRTVSKSSLLLSSPAPSRASSRASSSRTFSSNITSASRYNGPVLSDTSCWSNSDSSETLVSNSSTISSSSTPKQKMSQDRYASAKENKVGSSHVFSNAKVEKDGQFVRSLSVMKSKRAPPPPSRSYSLHSKVKRRSRDLLEGKVVLREQSTAALSEETEKTKPGLSPAPSGNMDSPGYHGDISSLDDSTGSSSFALIKSQLQKPKTEEEKVNAETVQKGKQEPRTENNVISPSSGYSSQNGTSPPYSKQPPGSSPKHKGFLAKLQFLFSGSSSSGLAPSLPAQPTFAEEVNSTGVFKSDTISVSPSVQTLRELFNIPPPPKIHAPPPPPPEVWAHSRRTFELLLGPPVPDNLYAIIKKNPKDRRQQRQSPSASTESSVKSLVIERKHKNPSAECVNGSEGSVRSLDAKRVQESGIIYAEIHKENNERLAQNGDLKENGKDEKVRVSESLNGMLVKHVGKYEERLGVIRKEEGRSSAIKATEIKTNMDTLPIISSVCISPPSSSKLSDHPVLSVQVTSPESPWPPPPPPTSQVSIGGSDETDTPLPPPPLFGERVLVSPVQVPLKEPSLCTTAVSVKPKVKLEQVMVTTMDGPQKHHLDQEEVPSSLSIPPPPPYTAPPPPTATITKVSLRPKEVSPPPLVASKEFPTSVVQDVAPPVTVVSSSSEKEIPPPVTVLEVSVFPPKQAAALPPENVTSQEARQSTGEEGPESKFTPPQSVPPPPPLLSQEIDLPLKNISFKPETKDLSNSVFIPPQNIPPPPPIEPFLKPSAIIQATNDDSAIDEVPPSPPFEFKNAPSLKETEVPAPSPPVSIPLPPPLPAQVSTSIKHQSSPLRTEDQNQEKTSTPDVHKDPATIVTPSLLQMVKLRSVNNSPEPSEAAKDAKEEGKSSSAPSPLQMVKLRSVNNSPEPSEAAKDVREEGKSSAAPSPLQMVKLRSVNNSPEPPETAKDVQEKAVSTATPPVLQTISLQSINSPEPPEATEQQKPEVPEIQQQPNKQDPTSSSNIEVPQKPVRKSLILTSPPTIIASEPTLPKSHSVVIPPGSSSTSPVKKSPTTTSSVSMNLQEAIRLRTAARSKEGPGPHFNLRSPLSPPNSLKSPTSTASFIFSKSNKVVPEMRHKQEKKEVIQKKMTDSTVTKGTSEAESKTGVKVPPPVAKKPKAKSTEVDASEAVEQTAGQEAQQDGTKDDTEELNGTAGTVQGTTPSA